MQSPASTEITVPTNNSPLPRGPHTCLHTPPQSSETHLLLTHLQSSLFQRLCTQTHTHIPSCHSLGSLTHRRLTLRCAHTAFPHTLTSANFLSAQLCSHSCTHTHTQMVGRCVGQNCLQTSSPIRQRDIHTSLMEKEVGGMSPPLGMLHHLTHTAHHPQSPRTPGGLPRTQSPACCPQFGVLGFLKCSYRMFSRVTASLFS